MKSSGNLKFWQVYKLHIYATFFLLKFIFRKNLQVEGYLFFSCLVYKWPLTPLALFYSGILLEISIFLILLDLA